MGTPLHLPPKGGGAPKFSAHVYYGQMAGWLKLVLGMAIGLSPGDIVLDGDSVPSPKRGRSPKFLEHGTVVIGLFKFKF